MRRIAWLAAAIAAILTLDGARADNSRWARAGKPAPGPARVIGFYSNGCVAGAVSLPLKGPGYRVLRPQRNRNWGHPSMIAFLKRLGKFTAETFGRPILVADVAQPRGGPISGHASHELGLDADVRLLLLKPGEISSAYLAKGTNVSMLTPSKDAVDAARWTSRQVRLLRFAASDPVVDRIFVHPVIKRELCRVAPKGSAWLRRVVPWYGHHAHMHVRVRCPADSPDCLTQKPVPAGDGCGKALAWWFQVGLPAARAWLKRPKIKRPPPKRRAPPPLPVACDAVINGK